MFCARQDVRAHRRAERSRLVYQDIKVLSYMYSIVLERHWRRRARLLLRCAGRTAQALARHAQAPMPLIGGRCACGGYSRSKRIFRDDYRSNGQSHSCNADTVRSGDLPVECALYGRYAVVAAGVERAWLPSRGVRFGDDAPYTGLVWRDHAAVKRVYFVQTCNQSEAARDVCVAGHDALTSF